MWLWNYVCQFIVLKHCILQWFSNLEYPQPCTFCMSPSSITPDSTHQLISGECKTWSGCVRYRETYKMCSAGGTSWRGLRTTGILYSFEFFISLCLSCFKWVGVLKKIDLAGFMFTEMTCTWLCGLLNLILRFEPVLVPNLTLLKPDIWNTNVREIKFSF